MKPSYDRKATTTGGRGATTRHIPPKLALAVGQPTCHAPAGWRWRALDGLAKLESGHTPSRRHPEYWGGTVPWLSIRDAKAHHGRTIHDTAEKTNELGIKNSSARILPARTVCLSRTASVGYVVVTGQPMATSQDFVNWICGEELEPEFLQYLLLAEGADLLRFASGAVHQTIYFPEAKAFYACVPSRVEQQRIAGILDEAFAGIAAAKANAEKNLQNARELFESLLQSILTHRGSEWTQTTLGTEIDLLAGFAFKSTQYTDADDAIRLLRGDNIIPGSLRWDDAKKWPAQDIDAYCRYQLKEGDIVLAMDRPWIKAGLKHSMITAEDTPCLLVQRTARLRGGANLDSRFLMYLIGSAAFTRHILGVQTGIGVPHISGQQISAFEFLKPPIAQQQQIADRLEALKTETQRLESIYQQKLTALDELKQSLLHQAFSGNL